MPFLSSVRDVKGARSWRDLMGDGVNIAARLERVAEAGGVAISGTAYDQLQGKLDVPLEFLGDQRLRNIDSPVRAYKVRLDGKSPALLSRVRGIDTRSLLDWGVGAPSNVSGRWVALLVSSFSRSCRQGVARSAAVRQHRRR